MTQTATPKTEASTWNQIILTGNLGQDPEMSYTKNGKPVTKFSLGVHQGKEKPTMWVNVECWNELAEQCNEKLNKGTRIEVTGRLVQDVWTDREGKKRYTFKTVAQTIHALKRGSSERSSGFIDDTNSKADEPCDLENDPF